LFAPLLGVGFGFVFVLDLGHMGHQGFGAQAAGQVGNGTVSFSDAHGLLTAINRRLLLKVTLPCRTCPYRARQNVHHTQLPQGRQWLARLCYNT